MSDFIKFDKVKIILEDFHNLLLKDYSKLKREVRNFKKNHTLLIIIISDLIAVGL